MLEKKYDTLSTERILSFLFFATFQHFRVELSIFCEILAFSRIELSIFCDSYLVVQSVIFAACTQYQDLLWLVCLGPSSP